MLDTELQTPSAARGHANSSPLDIDALLANVRAALEASASSGGDWRIVSFKALLPEPEPDKSSASTPPPLPPKKEEPPAPDNAPIKPGAPRIEVVYEWDPD